MNSRRALLAFAIGLFAACLATPAHSLGAGLDDRDSEPVVLTGEDTPLLIGVQPGAVVAFRYLDGWEQVPVQVDERKLVDYRAVRQLKFTATNEFKALAYADPNTWTEADGVPQTVPANPKGSGEPILGTTGDPTVDADDEIAMMAADAADSAAGRPAPAGVDPATRTPVRVTDPLDPRESRFIYLFRATANLDPAADSDYVGYEWTFNPELPGGYRTGYNFNGIDDKPLMPPSDPESSVVTTSRYEIGIPGRWMIDNLSIAAGDGSDILDGDKSTVGQTGCGRNELTFSRGGGGFIANIDGPVRAIRSFIGANSGTFTQRDYVFYEGLFENRTYLRVHPGINQFVTAMDLSPEAIGMTYRNELNPAGVTVDGVQDTLNEGANRWEQWSGEQGAVTNVSRMTTSLPLEGTTDDPNQEAKVSSYYQDMVDPPANSSMLCSGDAHSYGAGGAFITTPLNNSDPTLAGTYPSLPVSKFSLVRDTWFDGPEADAALGTLRSRQVDNPLEVATGAANDPTPPPVPPKLTVRVKPARAAMRPGARRAFRVAVRNAGGDSGPVKLCVKVPRRKVRGVPCRRIGPVSAGAVVTKRLGIRLKRRVRRGARAKVVFRVFSPKTTPRSARLVIRAKRR